MASLLFVLPLVAEPVAQPAWPPATAHLADGEPRELQGDPYQGWLNYLTLLANRASEKDGPDSEASVAARQRLAQWQQRIAADPHLLGTLRGVQEWAYTSATDGSGQPFKINIPTDYDPSRPTPLNLYVHGYSGNHLEHSTGMVPQEGYFEVAVLGRARGGWYRGLSEADVLDVLTYVRSHWNIDPQDIHISGGSMGGFASMWFGSRYPHLFASVQPTCGYALRTPVQNLLHTPVYSLHSDDDNVVSISNSRAPLHHLRDLGGSVVIEETTGFQHAVWNWADGNARAAEWSRQQVGRTSNEVHCIDYTAIDGTARRSWWGEIVEWGSEPGEARFVLNAGTDGTLYATLDNVHRLRVDLGASPLAGQDVRVSVNAVRPFTLDASLGSVFDLVQTDGQWIAAAPASQPVRPHTPGGALLLYSGEPLLIVYGTGGSSEMQAALKRAAIAASKSPNPSWPVDNGDASPADGIAHAQNTYGWLRIKADTEVTPADIERCHLVLLGTQAENSLVARIAPQLPVTVDGNQVLCSDGAQFGFAERTLGLVHYNPLSPGRLLLWIAASQPAAYHAGAFLPMQMNEHGNGVDFLMTGIDSHQLVSARAFDNRWQWAAPVGSTPLLPSGTQSLAVTVADALRTAAGAQYGLAARLGDGGVEQVPNNAPGITHYGDLANLYRGDRLYTATVPGTRLKEYCSFLDTQANAPFLISPRPATDAIDPGATYTVAATDESISALTWNTGLLLHELDWTPVNVADAILSYGSTAGQQ